MNDYQIFPISNSRTGFDQSLQPWLLPRDAYQQMINAHLYNGVLERILGYSIFAYMSYRNLIVLSPPPDGTNKTFTGTLSSTPTTTNFYGQGVTTFPGVAEIFSYASDASNTLINLSSPAGGTGTVDLTTLAVSLKFENAPANGTGVVFEWDRAVGATLYAIMGIKPYYRDDGSEDVMVFDQRRVGLIVPNMGIIGATAGAINGISEIPHDYYASQVIVGNGGTTYTGTLNAPFVPGTARFMYFFTSGQPAYTEEEGFFVNTIFDNGVGSFTGLNVVTASSTINYATGVFSLTFSSPITSANYFDATVGVYGNLFTASISNFFTLQNYLYNAFFTDFVDPIFYYDGATVRYLLAQLKYAPITSSAGNPTGGFDISECLHLTVNQNRLLLLSPVVDHILLQSTVYWSMKLNPFNFTDDEFEQAATSEPIRAFSYINTDLIVRFSNSERILRYTGDEFDPFRFDSTNNNWPCDAPYSPINYDTWFSSVGKPAIVGSNGVNAERADLIIPDFTDPTRLNLQQPVPYLSQTSIQQSYGQRFDDLKEGWLCYNSAPQDESGAVASDHVLAFNYLDKTYAVYAFPFSCLGQGRIINVPTWGTIYDEWQNDLNTWGSFQIQFNSLINLGGDQFDAVWQLDDSNLQTDLNGDPTPILMSVITKNFNPFIEDGQLARLGYIDLFVTANTMTNMRVQFYVNDQLQADAEGNPIGQYQENTITFLPTDAMSPTSNQIKVWKRIYVGAIGKTHTIRFYQNIADFGVSNDQPIYIHALILYMKPAGRIFN